jgi:hypothetical protein
MSRVYVLFVLVVCCASVVRVLADGPEPAPSRDKLQGAVTKGLRLVQQAAVNYPKHRSCFSCHHQTLPMLAMVTVRGRGLAIDEALLQAQADFSRQSFAGKVASLKEGRGVAGGALTAGYALWALDLAGRKADDVSQALTAYLLKNQQSDGRWATQARRPPLEESSVTATALAAGRLSRFAESDQRARIEEALGKAKAWLALAPVERQEDRNFRLWGLHTLGADVGLVAEARAGVLATQHDDGGWAARDDLPSDAYATGQTLVILRASGLPMSHSAYQRGVRYLLRSQQDDGSWKVESRSRPSQIYFDNGDPHGKHQFISTPATAWSVASLALALAP